MNDPAARLTDSTEATRTLPPDLEVRHEAGDRGGRFVALDGDREAGELHYVNTGETMVIFDHTDVGEVWRGRGVGLALVRAGTAWARTVRRRVVPLCPFAKATFASHPELRDVLG